MFWFTTDPVKKAAHKLFWDNYDLLMDSQPEGTCPKPNAYSIIYQISEAYCIDNGLPLSTIHAIKAHFEKWASRWSGEHPVV